MNYFERGYRMAHSYFSEFYKKNKRQKNPSQLLDAGVIMNKIGCFSLKRRYYPNHIADHMIENPTNHNISLLGVALKFFNRSSSLFTIPWSPKNHLVIAPLPHPPKAPPSAA